MKVRVLAIFLVLLFGFSISRAQEVTLSPATPAEAGMSAAVLQEGVRLFEKAVAEDALQGVVLLVARDGKVVLHEAVGWKDEENKKPMEKDMMFRMASNTKATIAAAVAMLADEGKLNFNDNVRKYLPSFDNYRAGYIKIRHLLSHTSGFRIEPIFLSPLVQKSAKYPNAPCLLAEVDRFGQIGSDEPPGTGYSYSNPGYNTLGGLVEVVSGKELEVFLQERLYGPLGMKDSYNHEVAEKLDGKLDRMGVVYARGRGGTGWRAVWRPGDPPDYPFVRASGGMISTAWDYAIFCQMFLNGGIYDGRRILKAETAKAMTTPQTTGIYSAEELEKVNMFYGFGWQVERNGVFSHGGSDGTWAWVDPNRKIIGLIFTQSRGAGVGRQKFKELVEASIMPGVN